MSRKCKKCVFANRSAYFNPCNTCIENPFFIGKKDNFKKSNNARFEKIKAMTVEEMAKEIVVLDFTTNYCKGKFSDQYGGNCPCDGRDELSCCIDWLNEVVE